MSYEIVKSLHIISVISWMAGMLYLPRLYVYHCGAAKGSELSETFKVMERKLLRFIINPAMIASWIFGLWLAVKLDAFTQPWLHAKFTLLILMQITHAMMARQRRNFAKDANTKSAKYYRWFNEVPTVLMIGIVFVAIVKPF